MSTTPDYTKPFIAKDGRKFRPVAERFWEKVLKTDSCWLWTSYKIPTGYGRFRLYRRQVLSHRFAYELVKGPIPEGLTLDHLCRNPSCVRPDHLEPVTMQVNGLRGEGPQAKNARKTHCIHGHEFTPENTIRKNNGGRSCRECSRRRCREYKARRKARAQGTAS